MTVMKFLLSMLQRVNASGGVHASAAQPWRRLSPMWLAALVSVLFYLPGCRPKADTGGAQTGGTRSEAVLTLLYSRIPTTLNPHLANGFQDFEAARIVYEPLATYQADGRLVAELAALIPTPENGGISADGLTVTWRLKPDVRWSDGKPFTAEDVAFTYQFVTDPKVAAVTEKYYEAIEKVEAVDPLTVKITFKEPNPSWALPFTGQNGMILPKHVFAPVQGLNVRSAPANLNPVGTGPYRFITREEGRWTFAVNEQYRDAAPAFSIVELEGGIAPYVAARRVLRDDTADFAHNLQLSIADRELLVEGGEGQVVTTFGAYVERVMLNFTDPNKETKDGERSAVENPHPFLSDIKVRQAINLAIDREAIATEIYGDAGQLTTQLLPFPEAYADPKLTYLHSPDRANALLDEAGWQDTDGNGIRDKDGVEMRVVFQTPINPVRQLTQARVKADLKAVGIEVENRRVLVDDFFSANPAQTRSLNHFYADMQEYNAGSDTPDPAIYMSWWLCDEIASLENQWQKPNNARYCNEDYDRVWEQATKELDAKKRSLLFQQLNAILMEDVAVIPLVRRAVTNGVSDRLTGVDATPWDASTWDIGTWMPVKPPEAEEVVPGEATDAETIDSEAVDSETTDSKENDIETAPPTTQETPSPPVSPAPTAPPAPNSEDGTQSSDEDETDKKDASKVEPSDAEDAEAVDSEN